MKNYQISPGQIPHLVSVTADLFRTMNHEIQGTQVDKSKYMHFVSDLLKDLVETAYPVEEKNHQGGHFQGPIHEFITITETTPFSLEQFEKAMKNINKIMKDYKPPKVGEF